MVGKCYCKGLCTGKGDGIGDGKCKKITISVFQSGSVIIGAKTYTQIIDAYEFISNVFMTHETELKKINAYFLDSNQPALPKKKKIIYYIQKSNIIY